MDTTTETLEIKIEKARANLPKESREAIDTISWRAVILGMDKKYTPEQRDSLEIETELLLSGLLNPEDYPTELETRMKISKNEVNVLINEMDRLVFKKMQEELEKKITQGETKVSTNTSYPLSLDSRFATLPQEVQDAIARSDYQKKLYDIGTKNKLQVDKMSSLEEITVKLIMGTISPSQYENELALATDLPADKVRVITNEVNEQVLKGIRGLMKKEETRMDIDDEVPIPPYKVEHVVQATTPVSPSPTPKIESVMFKKEQLSVLKEKDSLPPLKQTIPVPQPSTNIIANKLQGITISKNSISDHSLPKIAGGGADKLSPSPMPSPKVHDPYKEVIE